MKSTAVFIRVQKNPGFFKKAQPGGFFGFYWVFGFFLFERAYYTVGCLFQINMERKNV